MKTIKINTMNLFFAKSTGKVYDRKPSKNVRLSLDEIAELWKTEPTENYKKIYEVLKKELEKGLPYKEAKKSISVLKESLPYMLGSGYQNIGHDNDNIEFNGCIQLDVDFKYAGGDDVAKKVFTALKKDDKIVLLATSPSGFGVKALVSTDCLDRDFFEGIVDQVKSYFEPVLNALNIGEYKIDSLSLSQPLFIPMDVNTHYNKNASVLPINKALAASKKKSGKFIEAAEFEVNRSVVLTDEEVVFHFESVFEFAKNKSKCEPTDGQRNDFFKYYTTVAAKKGLTKEHTAKMFKGLGLWSKENESAFNRFYNKYHATNFGSSYTPMKKQKTGFANYVNIHSLLENEEIVIGDGSKNFVSEFIDENELPLSNNCVIVSKTGSGKTHAFLTLKNRKIVFVSPFQSHLKQNTEKYGVDIFCEDVKTATKDSEVINVTYSSFPTVMGMLGDKKSEYTVVVDEAHNFSTSTSKGYLLNTLNLVADFIDDVKNFILLTATPLPMTDSRFSGFITIRLNMKEDNRTRSINRLYYSDRSKALQDLLMGYKAKNQKTILYYNNTDEDGGLGSLQNDLVEWDLEFVTINSKTKGFHDYNELVVEGVLKDGLDLIVCTALFKEGIDTKFESLENNDTINYVLLSKMSHLEIAQISNRVRNAKNINVVVFKPKTEKESFADFDYTKSVESLRALAEKEVALYKERVAIGYIDKYLDFKNMENYISNAFGLKNLVRHDIYSDDFVIDELHIENVVYNKMRDAENSDFAYMMANLSVYGFKEGSVIHHEKVRTKEEKAIKKADDDNAKEWKERKIDTVIEDIMTMEHEDRVLVLKHEKDQLRSDLLYKTVKLTKYNLTDEMVESMIKMVRDSDVKFKTLIQKIDLTLYKTKMNDDRLTSEIKKLSKGVWGGFKVGNRYTSKDILDKMVEISKNTAAKLGVAEYEMSEANLQKTFQIYFQTKRVNVKNCLGVIEKGYEIISDIPLDLSFKKVGEKFNQ